MNDPAVPAIFLSSILLSFIRAYPRHPRSLPRELNGKNVGQKNIRGPDACIDHSSAPHFLPCVNFACGCGRSKNSALSAFQLCVSTLLLIDRSSISYSEST
jgi:hypothetical protein